MIPKQEQLMLFDGASYYQSIGEKSSAICVTVYDIAGSPISRSVKEDFASFAELVAQRDPQLAVDVRDL